MKHKLLLTAITSLMALSGTALADTCYVTIGTRTWRSDYVPYGNRNMYSTTQSIYTAEEIGTSGTIKALAYNVASASSLSTTSVQIYMGHTSKSSFSSSSDEESVSNMTLVYSGSPTLAAAEGWEELALTTPFAYNGTDNLIIVVGRQSNSTNSSASYYYSYSYSTKCLLRLSDYYSSSYGDPSYTGNYSTSDSRANVRLGIEPFKEVGQFCYSISSETTVTVCGTTAVGAVTIPSSVTIDGKSYAVTAILGGAFQNKTDITSVTIPSSVTNIGNDAFTGCTGIKEVKIEDGTTELSLGYKSNSSNNRCYYGLFKDCPIETLYLDRNLSYSTHSSYDSGYGAPFEHQSKMKSVTIGDKVTRIGRYAFYGCTGKLIVNCNIGDGSSSDDGWFYGSKFSSVEIGKDVTEIGNYAFYGKNNIQSLTIGSGVTEIGSGAFTYTPTKTIWLTNTQPSGYWQARGKVNYVSNTNFSSLDNTKVYAYLSSMFEDKGIKYVPVNPSERICDAIDYAYFEVDSTLNIASTVTYRNVAMNVKQIGEYFAYNNKRIKELKIGDAITTIGKDAFYGCSNLEEIAIPDATTSLGTYCFYDCTSLKKADTGDGITVIPSYAFSGCSALETIILGEGVKSIDTYAFENCSSLADIAIPSNVNKIDNYAFYGCRKLADVIIADRKETLTLGYNGSSTPLFSDCPLDSIYIGGKISYNTSSSYGYSPFYRNTSLRTVVITNEETEIYPNEFYGCTNLKNVKIGDGVKKIGDYAFSGCSSLEEFTFGTGLQSIGTEGFSDCTALKSLASKATTPPACGTQALDDVNKWDCTLYVPQANTAAYQAADQWKDFFFVSTIEGSSLEGDEEFEGVHRVIADGVMFSNTLTRDYDTITYVRNFTTHDWEAIYLPFSMSYDDWKDNYEVARINAFYQYDDDEDGKIDRSVLQAIKVKSGDTRANYPYLIRAKVPEEKSFNLYNKTVHTSKVNSTDCSTIDTKFTFVGIYTSVPGSALANKTAYAMEEGALKQVTAAMSIPACRWYIEVEGRTADSPAMAPTLRVVVTEGEEMTAVEELQSADSQLENSYSIDGRRAKGRAAQQGVLVKNGKKVFMK